MDASAELAAGTCANAAPTLQSSKSCGLPIGHVSGAAAALAF